MTRIEKSRRVEKRAGGGWRVVHINDSFVGWIGTGVMGKSMCSHM